MKLILFSPYREFQEGKQKQAVCKVRSALNRRFRSPLRSVLSKYFSVPHMIQTDTALLGAVSILKFPAGGPKVQRGGLALSVFVFQKSPVIPLLSYVNIVLHGKCWKSAVLPYENSYASMAQHTACGDGHKSLIALAFPFARGKLSSSMLYVWLQASINLKLMVYLYCMLAYSLRSPSQL